MSDAMRDLYERLAAAARPASGRRGLVIAFVGAGGKTSALFALAEAARRAGARRVALAATTKMRDPRFEAGRRLDRLVVDARLGEAAPAGPERDAMRDFWRGPAGETVALAARSFEEGGERKIGGVHPAAVAALADGFDVVLVEADGARGRSIKAPREGEPVVPEAADAVAGLVGLDCLGEELGDGIAHRPEILGPLVGCALGDRICPRHVAALVASPEGLFKGRPAGAARVALFNKAELAEGAELGELLELVGRGAASGLGPELAIACSLREGLVAASFEAAGARGAARPGEAGQ